VCISSGAGLVPRSFGSDTRSCRSDDFGIDILVVVYCAIGSWTTSQYFSTSTDSHRFRTKKNTIDTS